VRTAAGKWVQRPILYLGEIDDSQKAAWTKTIEVFDTATEQTAELAHCREPSDCLEKRG
jgi:hypothetical protein